MKILNILKSILCILLIFLISGCGGSYMIGDKIKLQNFPEAKDVSGLDMYWYFYGGDHVSQRDKKGLKPLVWGKVEKFKYPTQEQIKAQKQALLPKSGCVLDVEYNSRETFKEYGIISNLYILVTLPTLFLVPYYRPSTHMVDATIIDARTKNILKKYHFEESSAYWVTTNPVILVMQGKKAQSTSSQASFKLEEALIRTVTNDAYNFPECKK